MTSPSEKSKEELEKELGEIHVKLPSPPKIKDPTQVRTPEEGKTTLEDYRYQISMVMVLGFLVLLAIPLIRSEEELLQVIASILAGPVGAVIGYYFGVKKGE
jgi:hypothetical protein